MTKIEHKDGAVVKESFTYAMDNMGNITRTTEADGTYWDYGYDGGYRLTLADRKSGSGNIAAKYRYTYDDSGNILTKVEPFFEDFNDGNYTDWTLYSTWSASTGEMINSVGSTWRNFYRSVSDADFELRFDYRNLDTTNNGYRLIAELRRSAAGDRVRLSFYPDRAVLQKLVSGVWTDMTTNSSATTTQDENYHVRVACDGQDVTVWRWQDGELESQILTASTTITTTNFIMFGVEPYAHGAFDNIRLLSDSVSSTYTLTHNNSNELTAMAMPNGASAMAFGYDAWGRQTSKTQGSSSATYGYRYGSKLYSVASNFPGEGSVTYNYGGDPKRRQRTVGGVSTWYNWGLGWSVLNEESGTGSGTLQKTYVGRMAEIAGSNPATGAYSYYATDNLGSPRAVYSQAKALLAELDYTPYGQAYTANDTIGITHRYTGHDWDATAALYFAPYRFYNPHLARWMSRDPLGMVNGPNVYGYVIANPIQHVDPLGLWFWILFRLATLTVGVYGAYHCANCLLDAASLTTRAFDNLPFSDAWNWFCKAQPGTECGPICAYAVFGIMTSFLRTVLRLPLPKECCGK